LICVAIITAIKEGSKEAIAEIKLKNASIVDPKKKLSFEDDMALKFISAAASGAIFVINYFLKFSMRFFSNKECHETLTKMNVSVALKLTLARFINSSILLVLVNRDVKNWYTGGNLVY